MRDSRLPIGAVVLLIAGSAMWSGAVSYAQENQEGETADRAGSSEQLPQPVVGTHELMELFNEPLYKQLKQAMQEEPTGDEQWSAIEHHGFRAAELANLVAIRGGEHAEAEPEEWREYSAGLQQAGRELAEAAKTQDFQATQRAYRNLIDRCNACHSHFEPDHAPNLEP